MKKFIFWVLVGLSVVGFLLRVIWNMAILVILERDQKEKLVHRLQSYALMDQHKIGQPFFSEN